MAIKERQERDREAVRRSILDAARELFVAEGFQNVSIRKIAERIEYSPAAIYGYFPSKDDIFFALAEEGLRLLGDPQAIRQDPAMRDAPPLERVRAIFWKLYLFSRDQPQYFALIFVDRSVPRISREYERFAFMSDLKSRLLTQMKRCIDEGIFPSTVDANVGLRLIWAPILGIAALRLSERCRADEADDLILDAIDTTIAGLQAGAPTHARPSSESPS